MTSSWLIALALSASAATGPEQTRSKEQEQFWASLIALCGKAFEGQGIEAPTGNTTYVEKRLVMHVRRCEPDVVYIPFHVGENRSRTWVITRTAQGLRLKHDHRHEDGTEDAVTQYRRPHDDSGLGDASGLPHRKSFRSPDDLVPRSRSREDVCLRSQKRGHGSPFSDGVRSLEGRAVASPTLGPEVTPWSRVIQLQDATPLGSHRRRAIQAAGPAGRAEDSHHRPDRHRDTVPPGGAAQRVQHACGAARHGPPRRSRPARRPPRFDACRHWSDRQRLARTSRRTSQTSRPWPVGPAMTSCPYT